MSNIYQEFKTDPELEQEYLNQILTSNKDKNFVDRILNAENYPVIQRPDLGEGFISTHLMSHDYLDFPKSKEAIVYPTIIYDKKTKQLKMLPQQEAYKYAIENNEYIKFPTLQDAGWFSENYKRGTNLGNKK